MKLKNRIYVFLLFLQGILLAQIQTDIAWPSLANTAWPMLQRNPQLTGRSIHKGPQIGKIEWKVDYQPGIFAGPVIGPGSRLYYGYYSGGLPDIFHCSDLHGNLIWQYNADTAQPCTTSPLVASNGTIYTGDNRGYFYAFNNDGSLRWRYKTPNAIYSTTSINLDSTVYFAGSDKYLYALTSDGELRWKVKHGSGFYYWAPAISPDGSTLYISGVDSNFYALNTDGSIKWQYTCKRVRPAPLVDNAGNVYFYHFLNFGTELISLHPNGSVRWIYNSTDMNKDEYGCGLTMDGNGNLYYAVRGDTTSVLYSVNYQGQFRWLYQLDEGGLGGISQPLICDSTGTVYLGSAYGKNYYAITSQGTLLWKIPLHGYQADNTGTIGEDGTLYLGLHSGSNTTSGIGSLLAISDKTTGIKSENNTYKRYALEQNYPNPFNPETLIKYELAVDSKVSIKVYDLLGSEVADLVNETQSSGLHSVKFNGSNLPSGVYLVRMTAGVSASLYDRASGNWNGFTDSRKIVLMK